MSACSEIYRILLQEIQQQASQFSAVSTGGSWEGANLREPRAICPQIVGRQYTRHRAAWEGALSYRRLNRSIDTLEYAANCRSLCNLPR